MGGIQSRKRSDNVSISDTDPSLYKLITSPDRIVAYTTADLQDIAFTLKFGNEPKIGNDFMWLNTAQSDFNTKIFEGQFAEGKSMKWWRRYGHFRLIVPATHGVRKNLTGVAHIMTLYVGSKWEKEFAGNFYISK